MELASIIGGEPFSDSPRCVDRVVAAFLRAWNDRAGYADRQRLYPYASHVVGTGGYRRTSRIRRDLCLSWAGRTSTGAPSGGSRRGFACGQSSPGPSASGRLSG